jgi:hypothetical protein
MLIPLKIWVKEKLRKNGHLNVQVFHDIWDIKLHWVKAPIGPNVKLIHAKWQTYSEVKKKKKLCMPKSNGL